jgi:hypothetical protein
MSTIFDFSFFFLRNSNDSNDSAAIVEAQSSLIRQATATKKANDNHRDRLNYN